MNILENIIHLGKVIFLRPNLLFHYISFLFDKILSTDNTKYTVEHDEKLFK